MVAAGVVCSGRTRNPLRLLLRKPDLGSDTQYEKIRGVSGMPVNSGNRRLRGLDHEAVCVPLEKSSLSSLKTLYLCILLRYPRDRT